MLTSKSSLLLKRTTCFFSSSAAKFPVISSVPAESSWSVTELMQNAESNVLTTDTLEQLAELSRLHLEPSEIPIMLQEVEGILQFVKTIQSITLDSDVENLYTECSTTGAVKEVNLCKDIVSDGSYAEDVLSNAPDKSGFFFKVPKVVDI